MKKLDFALPFAGYDELNFISCFAFVYVYLQKIAVDDAYYCAQKEGKGCNGCNNCRHTAAGTVDAYYFIYDTFTGRSSQRMTFEGNIDDRANSAGSIDFMMGFAGYDYAYVTEGLESAVKGSINRGYPVIAELRDSANGKARVLTGYEEDKLIMAAPNGAQNPPENPPEYGELSGVYIINGKIEPRYTVLDGLYNIRRVMESVKHDSVWQQLFDKVQFWDFNLDSLSFDDFKSIFARIEQICWYNFNSHNFAEVFRYRLLPELKDSRLDYMCQKIGGACYGWFHDLNWGIIGANKNTIWDERNFNCGSYRPGICELVQCGLVQLSKLDEQTLEYINSMIAVMESDIK